MMRIVWVLRQVHMQEWDTSNDSRFIDFSGYWDTIEGRGFMIKLLKK